MKDHVVAEISVVPVGSGDKGLSQYVAACLDVLKEAKDIKYQLTPMSTILEGPLDSVFEVARKMHEVPFKKGAFRVLTSLKIDQHSEKTLIMDGKVQAVKKLHEIREGS
jgi:uncharacterized protein (TIGR00106 family)